MASAPSRDWTEIALPYGLWRDGSVTRHLRIRPLCGFDELMIEEARAEHAPPIVAGTALIARCAAGSDAVPLDLDAGLLTLGDREIVLRAIYAVVAGSRFTAMQTCDAGCGAPVLGEFDLSDLPVQPPEPGPTHILSFDGRRLTIRVPLARDLEQAIRGDDPARLLGLACGGGEMAADTLGAELARLDPNAECDIALECPECGAVTQASLDGFALIRRAIEADGGILPQVDRLARAYSWSEADILALPRRRRLRYLALAEQ